MAASSSMLAEVSLLRREIHALWLVRSRVIFTEIAFWLVLLGYDVQQRRFTNPIYTVYAILFFILWGFMVLLLLADLSSDLLRLLPFASPADAALTAGTAGMVLFFLVHLYHAAHRSPFHFSEEDASLLSFTPLDRRLVALFWFVEGWLARGFGVMAASVVTGYGLVQALSPVELTISDLPLYLLAGVRAFSTSVPLSIGLLGLAWAVGAWRLHEQTEPVNLRWLAPMLFGILVVLGLAGLQWKAITGLLPVAVLVQAGLGLVPWSTGALAGTAWVTAAVYSLWIGARGMSLSRAAQETHNRQGLQAASLFLSTDISAEIHLKRRMGTSRAPSRLPARPGFNALLWKEAVQSIRRFHWSGLFPWMIVMVLNLGLLAFPQWTTRVWMAVGWVLLVLHIVVQPVRHNLSRWSLLRQLPLSSRRLVFGMLALPSAGLWLAGAASYTAWWAIGKELPILFVGLYLTAVPVVALSGAIDIFRQARIGPLLVGTAPLQSFVGALLSLALVAALVGLHGLMLRLQFPPISAAILTAVAGLMVAESLWRAAAAILRRVR